MLAVPFLYFITLFFILYKKRGFSISAYIVLLYVITSFFAIFCRLQNLITYTPSAASTFLYCLLLTVCLIPVFVFDRSKYIRITNINVSFLNFLVYFFSAIYLIFVVAYRNDLMFRLTFGDFGLLRRNEQMAFELQLTSYGGIIDSILVFVRGFSSISFIMIFVFFLNILYQRNKKWYFHVLTLLSSTTSIVNGILSIDRSSSFYWLIALGMAVIMFFPYLKPSTKKWVLLPVLIIVGAIFLYFMSVSISRWGDRGTDTGSGFLLYVGQPYLRFGWFLDNWSNPDGFGTRTIFPAIHKYIIGDYEGHGLLLQEEYTLKTGVFCAVFYTFLGIHYIGGGFGAMLLFVLLYSLVFSIINSGRKEGLISMKTLFHSIFLLVIPAHGCIAYPYTSSSVMASVLIINILCVLFYKFNKSTSQRTREQVVLY